MVERPLTQQSRWLLTNVQTNQQFLNRVNHKVNELVSIKFKITVTYNWYNTICIIIIPTYLHWWIEYIIILLGYLNSVVFVIIGLRLTLIHYKIFWKWNNTITYVQYILFIIRNVVGGSSLFVGFHNKETKLLSLFKHEPRPSINDCVYVLLRFTWGIPSNTGTDQPWGN